MEIEVTFSESEILKNTSKETVYSLYSIFSIPLCSTKKMNYGSTHQRCSVKKAFLKISPNSQENSCSRISFFHLMRGKEKNWDKLENVPGKWKYLLQSYQGGYVNIKLFLILILALDKTNTLQSSFNSCKFNWS